jgi:hypothetical protein
MSSTGCVYVLFLLQDCVVYGVEVPGCEGRAGMLAVPDAPGRDAELRRLYAGLETRLPGYARPLFVRLVDHIDITCTYQAIRLSWP